MKYTYLAIGVLTQAGLFSGPFPVFGLLQQQSPRSFQGNSGNFVEQRQRRRPICNTQLNVIGIETVGIAVASAAVGAAARQPEIDGLQEELVKAKSNLEQSKEEMIKKIDMLEDKLFEMDQAYEAQTAKFQMDYETKKQDEISKVTEKMKTDYKFKLDIELEREKSKLLSDQFAETQIVDEQQGKLAAMRMRQKELEAAKQTLEMAVSKADEELQQLRKSNAPKRINGDVGGFWPF